MMKKKLIVCFVMLLALTGCSFPGLGRGVKESGIVIASGNTSERQILAEIVSQMIKHYKPEEETSLISNLASTLLILQTIRRDDANISSAMYTGTSLTGELNLPSTTDPNKAMNEVVKGYNEQFDMVWFPSYGFENTYAFMIRKDIAEKYSLEKISDLKDIAGDFSAGVDVAWIDRQGDGYNDFKRVYGFEFKEIYPMEIGLVYNAVSAKKMDIVLGYSTDGRIASYDLVILEDDLKLFPPYEASPVMTKKLLQDKPYLEEIFLKLEGAIPSVVMQELNRQSDEDHLEAFTIAKNFLEANHYFEEKQVVSLCERDIYRDIACDLEGIGGEQND